MGHLHPNSSFLSEAGALLHSFVTGAPHFYEIRTQAALRGAEWLAVCVFLVYLSVFVYALLTVTF